MFAVFCVHIADVMRTHGAKTIVAIDVGAVDDCNLTNYGDTLSGWWLLFKRWSVWSTAVKVLIRQVV